MIRIRDPKNFLAGLLFICLSIVLAHDALRVPLGTASEMGPGYFPLALGLILGVLGLIVTVNGLRLDGVRLSRFEIRGFGLVVLGIVAFGLAINWLGFIPSVLISVSICILASDRFRPITAVALTMFLVVFCCAIFIWGLGLPVPLFR